MVLEGVDRERTVKKDALAVYPIGSMVLLYMVTWIPSIYPLYVSICTSTMDPMGIECKHPETTIDTKI